MRFFRTFVINVVFFLNALLLFLVFFRSGLDIPTWLRPIGRMHPLLLHLPIGFLLLADLLVIFRSGFKKKSFHNFLNFVLYFTALTAVVSAIMGLFLSTEGGYNESYLSLHLYAGVGVSLLSWLVLALSLYGEKLGKVFLISLGSSTIVLLLAGHLGSVLTHGENFIFQSFDEEITEVVTDSTTLYAAAIHPILKSKCMSCHNDKKAKGQLIMASVEKILKGGKHGAIWVAGDPEKSTIIKRIHLPEENDDHMPPSGKPQLSKNEMRLIYLWIQEGADVTTAWTRFNAKDTLRLMAEEFIHLLQQPAEVHYTFAFASPETVASLNSPSVTVTQFALTEPALQADFFLSQSYNPKKLEDLLKVKEQLVILNLAKMPVKDDEGATVSQFANLEKLNLNQTDITGSFLASLRELKNLRSLSLAGTGVDRNSLTSSITTLPSLTQVFLWNTKVSPEEASALQKEFPAIRWDIGYEPHEVVNLTPPLLVNENLLVGDNEFIHLKHNLPGTQIRYTLDGSDPDSTTSPLYKDPISISGFTQLKTKAFKDTWYGSPLAQFYFFKKGIQPSSVELINPPNKDYKGEGAATLFNNKKGMADNYKDIAWLGYREQPFEALFYFDTAPSLKTITISYGDNPGSFLFPPTSAELWAGSTGSDLKLIERIVPVQPEKDRAANVLGIVFKAPPQSYKYYKIIAHPIPKVPVWVTKKPEKGWVFVDEVIFN